jgi:IS4 transposase
LRLNPQGIRVLSQRGELFPFVERLQSITRPGQVEQWNALVPLANRAPVRGRVCVVRKSEQATQLALKKLRRKVAKNNLALEPQTLLYASYVLVFTTLPEAEFSAHTILEWYRLRWQIELVFKRFKQIARLGHLPKSDPASARAWLYGKLLVALLTEKLIAHAKTISPWGYHLQSTPTLQPLA